MIVPERALVLPFASIYGERYDAASGYPDDNPDDLPASLTSDFELRIDGQLILDGDTQDVTKYLFGPGFFDPIAYPAPSFRFNDGTQDVYATHALWVVGAGCLLKPLPIGQHTIETNWELPGFFSDSQTIHVTVPRGR